MYRFGALLLSGFIVSVGANPVLTKSLFGVSIMSTSVMASIFLAVMILGVSIWNYSRSSTLKTVLISLSLPLFLLFSLLGLFFVNENQPSYYLMLVHFGGPFFLLCSIAFTWAWSHNYEWGGDPWEEWNIWLTIFGMFLGLLVHISPLLVLI